MYFYGEKLQLNEQEKLQYSPEKSGTTDRCSEGNKGQLLRRYWLCRNPSYLYLVAVVLASDISVWLRTASVEFGY